MAVKVMNETTEIREMGLVLPLAPAGNSLDDIFITADVAADGISFKQLGREVVTVKNTDPTNPYTFTIKSYADSLLRTGDIGPYSLAAGESATFILNPVGFKSAQGSALIVVENVAVKVAVNRTPGLIS